MATTATTNRRLDKARWLRAHPACHAWLRSQAGVGLSSTRASTEAADMVRDLKSAGLYSDRTVAIDICASMRRAALALEIGECRPTDKAFSEIVTILSRPGVNRGEIIDRLSAP